MTLDLNQIRQQFPALNRPVIFFDNPGGTQISRPSLDRLHTYLVDCNANHGGNFATSRASDDLVAQTRAAMADFLNAERPEEIIFGPNMTTLTFRLSRALSKTFRPGESLVVTRLEHDANIAPWVSAVAECGMRILWVDFDPQTGQLNLDDLQRALKEKPRLVAVGMASNALGTINPLRKITEMAHAAGALVFVDAVQYAPHGPIDVQRLGCDFLACSAYKFFGPHLGVLYGRYDLLQDLPAERVRPAPVDAPGKFETGTQNFEGVAGLLGALEYLAWVGETFGGELADLFSDEFSDRRLIYKQAMSAIRSYEYELSRALLAEISALSGVTLYGPSDPDHLDQRVPTFSFTLPGQTAEAAARALGERDIYTWNGNFYAPEVTERLAVEKSGGLLRVGAVHYNTIDEVHRLGEALRALAAA
jgi:cysteine desulfurase family protein (TIGR01976 family)